VVFAAVPGAIVGFIGGGIVGVATAPAPDPSGFGLDANGVHEAVFAFLGAGIGSAVAFLAYALWSRRPGT
jgi:hypothetical protein